MRARIFFSLGVALFLLLQATPRSPARLDSLSLSLNPAFVFLTFAAIRLDPLATAILGFSAGFMSDLMSGNMPGFYTCVWSLIFIPATLLRRIISTPSVPVMLIVVCGLSLIRALLESALVTPLYGTEQAFRQLIYRGLPETLLNTALAIPFSLISYTYQTLQQRFFT